MPHAASSPRQSPMGWIAAVRYRQTPRGDAATMVNTDMRHSSAGWIAIAFLAGLVLASMWIGVVIAIAPANATEIRASWYERGRVTASGERFHPDGLTCALPSFRPGHRPYSVRVTHTKTGRSITCRVNDRGPAGWTGNGIDLSRGAARALGMIRDGIARVRIETLNRKEIVK